MLKCVHANCTCNEILDIYLHYIVTIGLGSKDFKMEMFMASLKQTHTCTYFKQMFHYSMCGFYASRKEEMHWQKYVHHILRILNGSKGQFIYQNFLLY